MRLPEPFPLSPDVLSQQDAGQLLESGGRVVECSESSLALGDREGKHLDHSAGRVFELRGQFRVVDEASRLEDEVVADRDAGQEHGLVEVRDRGERARVDPTERPGLSGSPDLSGCGGARGDKAEPAEEREQDPAACFAITDEGVGDDPKEEGGKRPPEHTCDRHAIVDGADGRERRKSENTRLQHRSAVNAVLPTSATVALTRPPPRTSPSSWPTWARRGGSGRRCAKACSCSR